ncbi:unnamed protein product, partial [Didymodactylos carnosus]
ANSATVTTSDVKQTSVVRNAIIPGDSLLSSINQKYLSHRNCTVLIQSKSESSSIIYECGTNDVSDHSVESVIDDVKDVIKTTRELNPKIKISITSIPFRSRKLNVGGFNKIKDYNRQLKQLCMDQNVNFLQLNFEQGM